MLSVRALKIFIIILIDCAIVLFSAAVPLILRFGIFSADPVYLHNVVVCLPPDFAIAILVLALFRLYSRVWSFAGTRELIDVFKATLIIEAAYIVYRLIFAVQMPRSCYVFEWIFLFLLIGAARLSVRFYRQTLHKGKPGAALRDVMIVGAGSAASILIEELRYHSSGIRIVCAVDDNDLKRGAYISGVHIAGNRFDIPALVKKFGAEEIIIAMPSAPHSEIRDIIAICGKTAARIRILPSYAGSITSSFSRLVRDVNYEDLLGRNAVNINNAGITDFLKDKTIMVTGAGGSIGSELCRQIAANSPKQILLFDINENGVHDIAGELQRSRPGVKALPIIGSVRDAARIERIFREYAPEIIYHAAAHKHVPLMETSPCEAVKNNIAGTLTLAKLADKYAIKHFILISTDKAVRPTNVMGATKRVCELIIQMYNRKSGTRYVAVRFGNVLGSSGSVIPLFLKQIEEGGPVTVTHKSVTRFFMTISEAVSLVLQASIMNGGGELFILDMGEPVRIYDLAENLIKLKGLVPGRDIPIEITGLRPGEKLYEELLMAEEDLKDTENEMIFVGKATALDEKSFKAGLKEVLAAAEKNDDEIKAYLAKVCDTYREPEEET
ncbi:MAG: polysaccharide biosynthesis protein, partial [Clostridiales Family XIII bacterium]|nr:polysaccharide biosynthesis protein [Clostridiales Family XIII bacterium]